MSPNFQYDIVVLTDRRYLASSYPDTYSQNVVDEDQSIVSALRKSGLSVTRTNWDNPDFDWSTTRYILFRTIWDYFDRFDEFAPWLDAVSMKTKLINPKELIYWNIDKFYLKDLEDRGVSIPKTVFIEKGDSRTLNEIIQDLDWQEFILKPSISGAGRHTYRFVKSEEGKFEEIFAELVQSERMLIQEFQHNILTQGEVAFMVFGGKYSHAVLKRAKEGDFRVQDDFGGTIHAYEPTAEEISFVEKAISACPFDPLYARVDVMWDNSGELCLGELEMIEPELWFRMSETAAEQFAGVLERYVNR